MAGSTAAVAEMKKIAVLMQDSGLTVKFASGWETRGRSGDVAYWAVLAHHTAATSDIDGMLIQGRSDLPGPLCNWALHEDGTWVAIASGRANHAGVGTLPSSESYGIEATGPFGYPNTYGSRAFPQYDAYTLGCACILAVLHGDTTDLFGHKETARPLGRKIDPWFDMDNFRSATAAEEPGKEDDLTPAEAEAAAKKGAAAALNDWDSARPKNLSADPDNKPLTMTEVQGVWAGGIVGLQRDVAILQRDVAVLQSQLAEVLDILRAP